MEDIYYDETRLLQDFKKKLTEWDNGYVPVLNHSPFRSVFYSDDKPPAWRWNEECKPIEIAHSKLLDNALREKLASVGDGAYAVAYLSGRDEYDDYIDNDSIPYKAMDTARRISIGVYNHTNDGSHFVRQFNCALYTDPRTRKPAIADYRKENVVQLVNWEDFHWFRCEEKFTKFPMINNYNSVWSYPYIDDRFSSLDKALAACQREDGRSIPEFDSTLYNKDSVRDWYMREYSTDELGVKINPSLRFKDALDAIPLGGKFYDAIGVGDSVVRERIMEELAQRTDFTYDELYDAWICEQEPKHTEVLSQQIIGTAHSRTNNIITNQQYHYQTERLTIKSQALK